MNNQQQGTTDITYTPNKDFYKGLVIGLIISAILWVLIIIAILKIIGR